MKTMLLVITLLLLLGVGAFGQCCQSSIGSAPMNSVWTAPDHSLRAERHGLAPERDLREAGGVTMAQGELPAWEVLSPGSGNPAWRCGAGLSQGARGGQESAHRVGRWETEPPAFGQKK